MKGFFLPSKSLLNLLTETTRTTENLHKDEGKHIFKACFLVHNLHQMIEEQRSHPTVAWTTRPLGILHEKTPRDHCIATQVTHLGWKQYFSERSGTSQRPADAHALTFATGRSSYFHFGLYLNYSDENLMALARAGITSWNRGEEQMKDLWYV